MFVATDIIRTAIDPIRGAYCAESFGYSPTKKMEISCEKIAQHQHIKNLSDYEIFKPLCYYFNSNSCEYLEFLRFFHMMFMYLGFCQKRNYSFKNSIL